MFRGPYQFLFSLLIAKEDPIYVDHGHDFEDEYIKKQDKNKKTKTNIKNPRQI